MNDKKKLVSAIALSRNWNGEKISNELIDQISNKISSPKFILLFSTIHHESALKMILSKIKIAFPDSPVIGGTVCGFMSHEGCYTRGVAALAVDYPNLDVTIAAGKNTKRNPKKAAKRVIQEIDKHKSHFSNNLLLDFISGTKIPKIPLMGQKRVIINKFLPKNVLITLLHYSTKYIQIGMGRENEVLDWLVNLKQDSFIMGGSCNDDNRIEKNYQFYEDQILKNDIVGMNINTDLDIVLGTADGLSPTDIHFNLTSKGGFGCFMKTLDNGPAKKVFLNKMGWPEDYINEKTIFRKSYQYPIGYIKHNSLQIRTFGLFFNNLVGVANDLESKELTVYNASGKNLIDSYIELTNKLIDTIDGHLIFGIHCGIILEALGNRIYLLKDKISNILGDKPFLIVYTAGEHIYIPNEVRRHVNLSYNLAIFGEKKNEQFLQNTEYT